MVLYYPSHVPKKKPVKKVPAKKSSASKISKGSSSSSSSSKKSAEKGKKASAKKIPAKKVAAKKSVANAHAKKGAAKPVVAKKPPHKPSPSSKPVIVRGKAKTALTSTTAKGATTISVYKPEIESGNEVVVEEKKLLLLPPSRNAKPLVKGPTTKKVPQLKPIKSAPTPISTSEVDEQWSATELKTMRAELAKDLERLRAELAEIESEMDDLIERDGVGAGDDQADAGSKTFEREHEMSLVYNARDMVLQTERALDRIDNKSYGRCEDCQNAIGKARLQVFPRATLCMRCKAKEERR
jgi:DnaK suppressor protein